MPNDLFTKLLESFVTTWGPAIVSAVVSGFVLIWVHHMKVRQQIEIGMKREQLERRRSVYRKLMALTDQMYDYLTMVSDEPSNWRVSRRIYDELILVGSREVIRVFHTLWDKLNVKASPDEISRLMKDLKNAVRKDLFGEKPLDYREIKLIEPGKPTLDALKIFLQYELQLVQIGIKSLKDMANMDPIEVSKRTGIDLTSLKTLQEMARREIRVAEDAKNKRGSSNVQEHSVR